MEHRRRRRGRIASTPAPTRLSRIWKTLSSCCKRQNYSFLLDDDGDIEAQRSDEEELEIMDAPPIRRGHINPLIVGRPVRAAPELIGPVQRYVPTIGGITVLMNYLDTRIVQAKAQGNGFVTVTRAEMVLAFGYPDFSRQAYDIAVEAIQRKHQAITLHNGQTGDLIFDWRVEDVDTIQRYLAMPLGIAEA